MAVAFPFPKKIVVVTLFSFDAVESTVDFQNFVLLKDYQLLQDLEQLMEKMQFQQHYVF